MLLHDKIVWYDKVLRHHATRMLSSFYDRDGWAHVARVYGVDNELLKLLTKPKRMMVEENKMILDSMVYAARELEGFTCCTCRTATVCGGTPSSLVFTANPTRAV